MLRRATRGVIDSTTLKLPGNRKIFAEKAKELISGNNYISWLEQFTDEHPEFTDIEFENVTSLSEKDSTNVKNLRLFFRGIDNYFQRNNLSPIGDDYGYHFFIHYNDYMYKIGISCTFTSFCYCKRCNTVNSCLAVDFFDIMNEDLIIFQDNIKFLLSRGIDAESLTQIFNDVVTTQNTKNDKNAG